MSILINELQGFQTIPCNLIEQDAMSVEARFLYCIMAVKPNEWVFYRAPLMKQMHIEDARTFKKYMQELIDSGWVTSEGQERNTDGTYGPKQYTIKAESPTEVQKMQPRCKNCRTAKNAPHNKYTLIKQSTTTAHVCTREEKFLEDMLSNQSFMESVAMMLGMKEETYKEELEKKAQEFKVFITGCTDHLNQNDYNQHFRNWILKRKDNEDISKRHDIHGGANSRPLEVSQTFESSFEG